MISLSTLIFATALAQTPGPLSSIPEKYLAPNPSPGKVVATVNGIPVTAKDVQSLMWPAYADTVVEEIINYVVVRSEAQKQSVKIPLQAVESEVAKQIKLTGDAISARPDQFPAGTTVDQVLRQQGLSRSLLYMGVETHMLAKSLILRTFDASDYAVIATIIISRKSDQTGDVADAAKRADAAYKELTQGAKWDEVLKTYTSPSELTRALPAKGVLGWRMISALPSSVQTELKHLRVGGYTTPALTENGFQIFRLDMMGKDAKGHDLDQLKEGYVMHGEPNFIAKLRKAAKIVHLR